MSQSSTERGFTIIEVILVLTITVALLVGLLAGTSSAVARQRYHDSVSSFRDFLQNQYSFVANVQNDHEHIYCYVTFSENNPPIVSATPPGSPTEESRGRSDCLIYGRLLEFYVNAPIPNLGVGSNSALRSSFVRISTIIGAMITLEDIEDSGLAPDPNHGGDIGAVDCDTGEVNLQYPERNRCIINYGSDMVAFELAHLHRLHGEFLGSAHANGMSWYQLEQGASLVQPQNNNPVAASVFILRGPISGAIRTFIFLDQDLHNIDDFRQTFAVANEEQVVRAKRRPLDFCIASPDIGGFFGPHANLGNPRLRRMVSIAGGGSSPAAVQIMPLDMSIADTHGSGRWNTCWERN